MDPEKLAGELNKVLGPGLPISDSDTPEISMAWTGPLEVALAVKGLGTEQRMRKCWKERHAGRATPLLLVSATDNTLKVLGPISADAPIRAVDTEHLLAALESVWKFKRAEAARSLAATLERLDEAAIPGVLVRGLLTRYVLTRRLRRSKHWAKLEEKAKAVRRGRSWQENMGSLGYKVERADRGYVLRSDERPVAVVHPYSDPVAFARTTEEGSLPEGILISDCRRVGARYGLLATDSRFRVYQAESPVGAATGRHLEFDLLEVRGDDWPLLGLLAPDAMSAGGILDQLVDDARRFGNELQLRVEQRIREKVLPVLARGFGHELVQQGSDMADPEIRKRIEDAVLTLLFRVIFILYCEGRGYLPLSSESYRPHAATTLIQDARRAGGDFDERATTLWDRFMTLLKSLRTGNAPQGIPPYDGDLFARDGLPGAELLEEVALPDSRFGSALVQLGFDPDADDPESGIDYAGLEVPHLGNIYEGLLALKLSLATEPLRYDTSVKRYLPVTNKSSEVTKGELFYQSEAGGRKAGGVYYTPQVLVRHLVNHALRPALRFHLERIATFADPKEAADKLFDFSVVDPAMGSGHFLADALDIMADDFQDFLAANPLPEVRELLDGLRTEAGQESVSDGDLLRRLIVKRCIYGVDLSSMAVEVAKISLWLATFVPGLSLAYLSHNLRDGNSLIGIADIEVLGQDFGLYLNNPVSPLQKALDRAAAVAEELSELSDRDPVEVERSRGLNIELDHETAGLARVFNMWCAEAFAVERARDQLFGAMESIIEGSPKGVAATVLEAAEQEAAHRQFFHWPAAFPEVFWRDRPGFDVVIGNPPWEEVTIERLAFFALHDPGLRGLKSEAGRQERINELTKRHPALEIEFEARQEATRAERIFYRRGNVYQMQGAGDTDLYKLFCERYGSLARNEGWLGVVLPRSAFLADGTRGFRRWVFEETNVARLDFIVNNKRWVFDTHPQYTIALPSIRREEPHSDATLSITGPSDSEAEFAKASDSPGVSFSLKDLVMWTPAPDRKPGFEVPLIPSERAVSVFEKIRNGPRFDEGYEGIWQAFPVAELHETADKSLFRHKSGIPVWKGGSFERWDPHGLDPAGYAKESETMKRLQKKRTSSQSSFRGRFATALLNDPKTHPFYSNRVAFRDVTRATDSRTVRACLVPPEHFLGNTAPYLVFEVGGSLEEAFVLGILNSLPFDWQARRFVETHVNFFILNMLCLPPQGAVDFQAIAERSARLSCVDDRFKDFADDCGVQCAPLADVERLRLMAEVDALICLGWNLDSDDLEEIFTNYKEDWLPSAQRDAIREALQRLGSPKRKPRSK